MAKQDYSTGFRIEEPPLGIPFGISPATLDSLAEGRFRKVNEKYFAMPCVALAGLPLQLGFHFKEAEEGLRLFRFEVFFDEGDEPPDFAALFPVRQAHLERALGPADAVQETKMKGFAFYRWEAGGTVVEHFLRDRFGLEEHITFVNNG